MGMKKANLLGMMLMMGAMSEHQPHYTESDTFKPKRPKKKIIPKGLKEFFYGANSLYALNQKNADRKATKKGWLIHGVVKSLPLNNEPPQVIKDNGLDAKDWDNDCT